MTSDGIKDEVRYLCQPKHGRKEEDTVNQSNCWLGELWLSGSDERGVLRICNAGKGDEVAIKRTLHRVGKENSYMPERQVWPSLISYVVLPVNLGSESLSKKAYFVIHVRS